MAETILAALLLSLLTGGSLRHLARERIRGEAVLVLLLPTQLIWPTIAAKLEIHSELSTIIWLMMMAILAVTLMMNAHRRPALALAALGIAANVLVIGVNQAMPVDIRRASEIGVSRQEVRHALERDGLYEELDSGTLLPTLADVIAVPGPAWQRGVVSVGDLILAMGLSLWVFAASRPESTE